MNTIKILLALFLLNMFTASGQTPEPKDKSVEDNPSARYHPAMTFDGARKKIILFGGMDFSGKNQGDTWEWDGALWKKASETGPDARSGHAMTYDSRRKRVVLFGGLNGSRRDGSLKQFSETWEWDGMVWKQVAAVGPAARAGHQLVYDRNKQKAILFGGADIANQKNFGDTWEWDGKNWTQIATSGPEARFYHLMSYDSARKKVVLFGGNVAEGQLNLEKMKAGQRGDTWEFDGKMWTKINTSGPTPRDHHAMAYDAMRKNVILFGGWNGNYLGDTWAWDGKSWKQVASTGPPVRGGKPGISYDDARKKVVLFGGGVGGGSALKPQAFNDTWEWDGKTWLQIKN